MATAALPLLPVIVTARPLTQGGMPYQQLPAGTDAGALRIVEARQVRHGDWLMGDCEQPTGARHGRFWGVHSFATYAATPSLSADNKTVAMDGEHYLFRADELVMITPRECVAQT